MASCCLLEIAYENLGYGVWKLELSSFCFFKEKLLFEVQINLIQFSNHLSILGQIPSPKTIAHGTILLKADNKMEVIEF